MNDSVNLSNCADEPIQFPGAIQPHGVLFIVDAETWRIKVVSENVFSVLGFSPEKWIEQSLISLFSEGCEGRLKQQRERLLNGELEAALELQIDVNAVSTVFDARMFLQDSDLIVELDNQRQLHSEYSAPAIDVLEIQSLLARLGRQNTIVELANAVVREVRLITGYDRIMVYRFHEDCHGEVIAESVREGREPYLGLHFPESDIPEQARRLYCENLIRCIVSSDYVPVPLLLASSSDKAESIDLSHCQLRSVSPIHLEYLRNMGVGGSMSISLMDGEHLWGLIACHHYLPRFFDYRARKACELLGTTFSLMMSQLQEAESAKELLRLQDIERQLVASMASTVPFIDGAFKGLPNLSDLVNAHGAVSVTDDLVTTVGLVPSDAQIRSFLSWLVSNDDSDVFTSHNLTKIYPEVMSWDNDIRGVLVIEIARKRGQFLLCFRRQLAQTIHWAGNPDKNVTRGSDQQRLKPRESFADWAEKVADQSKPWTRMEESVAHTLRRTILHVIVDWTNEVAILNRKLSRSNDNLQSFAEIAAHDLKEPLRGIDNYIAFFREDHSEQLTEEMDRKFTVIDSLARRGHELTNALLSFAEVGNTSVRAPVKLDVMLDNALDNIDHLVESSGIEIRRPKPLPVAWADNVLITQVFQNLLSNAIKYSRGSDSWIEVSFLTGLPPVTEAMANLVYHEGDTIICVKDNGIGIAQKHLGEIFKMFKRLHPRSEYAGGNGIGLAISQRIVEFHEGYLWVASTLGEGSSFYFTLRGKPGLDVD